MRSAGGHLNRGIRWGLPIVACLILVVARSAVVPAAAAPTTSLSSCDSADLLSAISTADESSPAVVQVLCSGTIVLTSPIVVSGGDDLTLDASTAPSPGMTLSGGQSNQVFDVQGGTLNLVDVDVTDGLVQGVSAGPGVDGDPADDGDDGTVGANGNDGTNGGTVGDPATGYLQQTAGQEGADGTDGEEGNGGDDGGDAANGGDAQGGAMYIAAGATVDLSGGTFSGNDAVGGNG